VLKNSKKSKEPKKSHPVSFPGGFVDCKVLLVLKITHTRFRGESLFREEISTKPTREKDTHWVYRF
jgi:hypothetical protein